MKTPKDVDEYIASAPKEVQGKLKELRAAIWYALLLEIPTLSYRY